MMGRKVAHALRGFLPQVFQTQTSDAIYSKCYCIFFLTGKRRLKGTSLIGRSYVNREVFPINLLHVEGILYRVTQ